MGELGLAPGEVSPAVPLESEISPKNPPAPSKLPEWAKGLPVDQDRLREWMRYRGWRSKRDRQQGQRASVGMGSGMGVGSWRLRRDVRGCEGV